MASIRKRTWTLASGETRTAWLCTYGDKTGKRRLHRQFKTRKAAAEFLATAVYEVSRGTHTPASIRVTLAQAVEFWLEHKRSRGIDDMTLRGYEAVARNHVVPFIGYEKIAQLNQPAVEQFVGNLLSGRVPDGQKRSPIMARKALQVIKAALKEAKRRGLAAQNVAADVAVEENRSEGAGGRKEIGIHVPSPAEVRAMLEAVSPKWRPLFVVGVFCGLRGSELRGLCWQHVDFKAKVIRVRQRADIWGAIGRTKSKAGERDVPLAPMVANTLRAWKLACPPSELNLVFPSQNGRVLDHSTLYRAGFGQVQVQLGILRPKSRADGTPMLGKDGLPVMGPKYSPHDFRHFTASWLIDQGFEAKRIQGIMGHANIAMTYDTYGHLFPLAESDHDRLAAGELALVNG